MKQADLIRTALALRYASVLTRGLLDPIARHAVALEADRFGDPPPSTVALTNHLLAEAEAFLAGQHAGLEIAELRAQLQLARAALHYLTTQIEHAQALLVGEGQVEEAAAVLHDLLTVPGVSAADEQVDAALARAGEAPGTKQADIEEFEAVLQTWATGGYMLKPVGLTVEFPEPSSAGGSRGDPIHAALAKYCDEQASKRIIGQTMTSDTGASRAQAEVHERVAGWVIEADAAELAETILRDLVEPYVRMNFGMDVSLPRVYAVIESNERRAFQLEALKVLVPLGMRVEQSVARDLGGFPEPAEGAELLGARGAPPPAASSRRRGHAEARRFPPPGSLASPSWAPPRPGTRFAADDHEDIVDRDAGGAAGENWRADLQPFVEAAEAVAEEASSFDDYLRKLGKRTVDGSKLVRNLATATMQLRGVGDGTDEVE